MLILFGTVQTQEIAENLSLKNYQCSTEGEKFHRYLAPVLVRISGNSLVLSRKVIASTGFTRTAPPTRQRQ